MPRLPDLSTRERPIPRAPEGIVQLDTRTGMESIPAEQATATGHEFSQLAVKLQTMMDETEADAANTAYDNQRREVLFGQTGFYNQKGRNALDAMQPTTDAIEKLRTQNRSGLTTPEQKRMYDYMSRRSTQSDLRSMSLHAVQEGNRYALNTNNAALVNEVNNSGAYRNDSERFGESLGKIAVLVEQGARLRGETDQESIRVGITHWQSDAWIARIKGVAESDPVAAQQILKENAESISLPQRIVLESQLKREVMPVQAKRIVDAILPDTVRAKDTWALYGDLRKQVEEQAGKLYQNDPVFKDLADRELKAKLGNMALAQKAVQNQALQSGLAVVHGLTPDGKPVPKPLSLSQAMADPRFRGAYDVLDTDGQAALERGIDMNLNRVEAQERRAEAAERRRERRERMPVDNARMVELARRIDLPWGTPGKIYDVSEIIQKDYGVTVDEPGLRFLSALLKENQDRGADSMKAVRNGALASFKPQFTKDMMGMPDQFGAERFNTFHQWAIDQEEKLKREGKDPRQIYNADSPDYIGKSVNTFRPTIRQRQQQMLDEMRRQTGRTAGGAITLTPKPKPGTVINYDKNGNPVK